MNKEPPRWLLSAAAAILAEIWTAIRLVPALLVEWFILDPIRAWRLRRTPKLRQPEGPVRPLDEWPPKH